MGARRLRQLTIIGSQAQIVAIGLWCHRIEAAKFAPSGPDESANHLAATQYVVGYVGVCLPLDAFGNDGVVLRAVRPSNDA
jgi:hypothetical protein